MQKKTGFFAPTRARHTLAVGGRCNGQRFTVEALLLPWLPSRALSRAEGAFVC